TGIREPNAAFISRSTAEKYFGDQNPIGETFSVNKKTDYKITGIFEDIPANSHIKFDFLLPWENLAKMMGPEYTEAWGHTGAYTYLKVQPGTDPRAFEKKLLTLVAAECPWLAEYHMTIDLVMQPLTDIHLASHFMQEFEANGDRDAVNLLLLVAVFIMIMAWINYINLSTAFSLNRAKEVGLRKVIGASRRQLTVQFFLEVAVINLFSILAAVWFISLLLPLFGDLTGVPPEYSIWSQSWFLVALAVIFAGGVLFSGLYPVMILSSFRPASVLKGKLWNSARGVKLRRALVISQFTVGVVLIIATMTVYRQISFMRSQEPGFRMDHTLVVKAPRVRDENYGPKFETFRENLLRRPDINRISHVTEVPGRQIYWDAGGIHKAGTDIDQSKNYQIVGVDYDFADVFELKFAAGRNFSKEFPADKTALILNETAVSYMGFVSPDSAIGQKVDYWGEIYPIIGVLKNYHQQSLKEEFEPHIFRFEPYGRGSMGMIAFTLKASDVRETVAAVKQQYDEFFPDNPFNYFFLDDYFNQQYRADELFGKVYSMFALLAVVITALGVYGLSSYSITRHTKEIGIRKVLGASVANIVRLLTREYIVLIVIANLIAWPIAWVTMNRWLENFAWRTTLGIGVFVLAGVFI
ncbi:MAG: ABC transporter permease, partial [Candidatus Zixiibacteriota bacterium]